MLHMESDSLELDTDAKFDDYIHDSFRGKFEAFLKKQSFEIIGVFVNENTATGIRCINCKHEWNDTPKRIMENQYCPICRYWVANVRLEHHLWKRSRAIIADKQGKTIRFSDFDPDIKPTVNDQLKVKCKNGHKFTTTHRYLRRNRWCKECPREPINRDTTVSNSVYKNHRKTKQAILNEVCKQKGVGMISKKNEKGTIGLTCFSCKTSFRKTPYQILNNLYLCPSECVRGVRFTYNNFNK